MRVGWRIRAAVVIACAAIACAACGDGGSSSNAQPTQGPRTAADVSPATIEATSTPPADLFVLRSGSHLADATSYRLRYELTGPFEGSITGDGEYGGALAAWARMSLTGPSIPDEAIQQYLFLPPDLYLEQGNGDWLVQSPWNQGVHVGDETATGLVLPIVDYDELAAALHDLQERPDDAAESSGARHLRAKVFLRDVSSLSHGTPGDEEATVDVWIDVASELPRKVEVKVGGDAPGKISMDFGDYGESVEAPPIPDGAHPLRDLQFPDAPCTADALTGCLAAQTAITSTAMCDGVGRRVCLAPLGMVSTELVDHLVAYYRDEYGLEVTVLKPSAIPASLEDSNRQQVDAAGMIEYMGRLFPDAYRDTEAVMIGLTPIDVYDATSTYRYVFGVKGTASDPKAVISSARMDPLFYSEPEDQDLFFSRTRKMFSKYVGLLYYRLPTSSDPTSPMYDSIGGPLDVDAMTEPLAVAP